MPNAYNIRALRASKKAIELKSLKAADEIKVLMQENKLLDEQIAELELKESNLASNLLEELRQQKTQNANRIQKRSDEMTSLRKQLEIVNRDIRYPDPKTYIEEQVAKMVVKFNKHVQLNEGKLGLQITTRFVLKANVRKASSTKSYSYDIPTGDMGIYIEDATKPIIASKDFPFTWMELYIERERGWYCLTCAEETVWFEYYKETFANMFFECLQKKFDNVAFKLTIDRKDNSFTLNLV